jgi:hypothetical protein
MTPFNYTVIIIPSEIALRNHLYHRYSRTSGSYQQLVQSHTSIQYKYCEYCDNNQLIATDVLYDESSMHDMVPCNCSSCRSHVVFTSPSTSFMYAPLGHITFRVNDAQFIPLLDILRCYQSHDTEDDKCMCYVGCLTMVEQRGNNEQ